MESRRMEPLQGLCIETGACRPPCSVLHIDPESITKKIRPYRLVGH